jgi:hypothetical protein
VPEKRPDTSNSAAGTAEAVEEASPAKTGDEAGDAGAPVKSPEPADTTGTGAEREGSNPAISPATEADDGGTERESGSGLPVDSRASESAEEEPVELLIVAESAVRVTLSADGGDRQTRRLPPGGRWRMSASDRFLLSVDDPSAIRVELGGQPYELPDRWGGEEKVVWTSGAPR